MPGSEGRAPVRLALALLILAAAALPAQRADTLTIVPLGDRMPKPAGARTIVGIVVDTSAVALDSIDVYIASLRKRTTTDSGGRFRFDDVKPGTYDVTARRIGYYSQVRSVKVDNDGGVVAFGLVPVARTLAPVITVSPRGGLSGVVGDTAYQALAGAEVAVLASSHRTLADSTGAFYLPLRPGRYMVRVKRDGFAPRLVSVTIPPDSGRRVMVWLAPPTGKELAGEEFKMQALQERMAIRTTGSKVFTREDLLNSSMTDLIEVVHSTAIARMRDDCEVVVDGGPHLAYLWELRTEEIESVEVYPPGTLPNPARGVRGNALRGNSRPASVNPNVPARAQRCGTIVFVWLRK